MKILPIKYNNTSKQTIFKNNIFFKNSRLQFAKNTNYETVYMGQSYIHKLAFSENESSARELEYIAEVNPEKIKIDLSFKS